MSNPKLTIKLQIGQRVFVAKNKGTVRYVGKTGFAQGPWVGIELDEPKGKNNGSVKGHEYFKCEPKYGLFARPGMIKPMQTREKRSSQSSKTGIGKSIPGGPRRKGKSTKKKPTTKQSLNRQQSEKAQAATEKLQQLQKSKATLNKNTFSALEGGAIKELESELTQLKSTIKDQQLEIAALKEELKTTKAQALENKSQKISSPTSNSEVLSLKAQIEKLELEKEEAVSNLESQVVALKVDKEIADEQVINLEDELEGAKQDIESLTIDLETLELEKEEWKQSLSPDMQTQQALMEENGKLKIALATLKQKYESETAEQGTFKEQALEKLSKFKEMEDKIILLTDELTEEKEKTDEMQQAMDEMGSHEDELEQLTEKNLELDSKYEEQIANVEYLNTLKETNEEIIEQQQELNSQLSADLDQKEMEIDELNAQLSLKLKIIEDLHQTQRKFKDHVKHLESEVMETRNQMNRQEGDSKSGDQEFRQARKVNMQLQARVSEVRGKTVDYVRAKIEKEEYVSKMRFFEMHIPDNLNVDHNAIELILVLDRLKAKSVEAANLLGEFYGKESHNENLAACTYDLCGKLLSLAKRITTLRRCIEKCDDDETFAVVVDERKLLKGPEECIDELLVLISGDRFDINYNKSGIDDAQENIVGFVAAHFMTDEDDHGNRRLKTTSPLSVLLDVQELVFQQELIATYFQCLEDLFEMVPKKQDSNGNPLPNSFENTFDKMKQLCDGNSEKCKQMLNHAETYQITCENRSNISGANFAANIKNCSQAIFGCGVRVKEILQSFNDKFARQPPDEKNRDYFVSHIESRLDAETSEDRLESRMQSTQNILNELATKLKNIPDINQNSALQKTIPLWEQSAQQVRKELLESASMKSALEEAQSKVEERERAWLKSRNDAQNKQAQIDVLQAKWDSVNEKMGHQGEIEKEADKLRKRVKQQQDASDVIVKDLGKYQSKNKVLRQKVLKLKVEIKTLRASSMNNNNPQNPSSGNVSSLKMATHEIALLVRTIRSMRYQLAQVRCTNITRNLNTSLPILPVIWGGAHTLREKESTTEDSNTAITALESFIPSPFYGDSKNDAQMAQKLSLELCDLSNRVTNFRATPKLVDVSKIGIESKSKEKLVSPGQQWLSRQKEAQKLKDDSVNFNKRLQSFLDSKRSHAFRSLFSSLAAPESAVLGGGGQYGQLVGKVTVPSVSPGGNAKVTIDRNHLSQLHSSLVD